MKRIDGPAATFDLMFTEGDPGIPIAATVVTASWLNTLQEEISLFVESQGIVLDQSGVNVTQFQQAIANVVGTGGAQSNIVIVNNQVAPLNIAGLLFNKATIKSVRILFDIHRETTTQDFNEMGELFVLFDSVADDWILSFDSKFDDAGVIFTITAAGQIQYTSNNLAGGSYVGLLRFSDIKTLKQVP